MRSKLQTAGTNRADTSDVLKHLADSIQVQWRRYRKRLGGCQRRFSEDAIHELRVEIRRLLATLELLRAFIPGRDLKKARQLLKKHLDLFDRLRDTQVQLGYARPITRSFPAAEGFRDWLSRREARFTRAARHAVKRIKTRRLRRRLARFEKEIRRLRRRASRTRALTTALRAIDRTFGRVDRCRRLVNAEDTLTIHRTRVAFKRFRYMVEAMSPLLPDFTEAHRSAMHAYQSMMGDVQDVEMLLAALGKFLERQAVSARAGRKLRRELSRRRQALIQIYLGGADRLRQFWPLSRTTSS